MKEDETPKNVIPLAEDPQEGECAGARPRRKPDFTKRGKFKGWNEEGHYEFTEYNDRPDMIPEVIHKGKCVTVTKTQGEKDSSIIVRAKVDASLPDPIGTAMTMMAKELKDKVKKEPKFNPSTFLFESDELKVWQNVPQRKLHVHIALDVKSPQLMLMQLQELQTDIYKTINKSFLYKIDPGLANISFSKVRNLREGIDMLATHLMNVLVFDTDSIILDRLVGKVYLMWMAERKARGKTQFDIDKFAEDVRQGVVASFQKALGKELREPTPEDMDYVIED